MNKIVFSRLRLAGVALTAATSFSWARADSVALPPVVKEVTRLRNSLAEDDPMRPALTLRLADLLFNQANEVNRSGEPNAETRDQVAKFRRRALDLYKEALAQNGDKDSTQIHFQMARLLTDLGENSQALAIWKNLSAQSRNAEIEHEATVRVAENLEEQGATSEAEKAYAKALSICPGDAACFYARYRHAWTLYHLKKFPAAQDEMAATLFDRKGTLRDEPLKDLFVFWSSWPQNSDQAISTFAELSKKLQKPDLVSQLAESFLAAGERGAALKAFERADRMHSSFKIRMRLLEESYAAGQYDSMRSVLDKLSDEDPTAEASGDKTSEKILRRFAVQLDAERKTRPQFTDDFKKAALVYIKTFIKGDAWQSMVEGWIAAEQNADTKLSMLKDWMSSSTGDATRVAKLRELRAAVAQQSKHFDVVSEEMKSLAAASSQSANDAKAREYRYIEAHSLYEAQKYDQALPLFEGLARGDLNDAKDKWAVQSQHLALDILNTQKAYAKIVDQARTWTQDSKLAQVAALQKDLADMKTVEEEALFQDAVQMGTSPVALDRFKSFCMANKLLPQSCKNAEVLAAKLGDNTSLLAVLERSGGGLELAEQYEAAAFYDKAARAFEKLQTKAQLKDLLHTALLYELANEPAEQARVLKSALKMASKAKLSSNDEQLLTLSIVGTPGLEASLLKQVRWSNDARARLAVELERKGLGNAETRQVLLASTQSLGVEWGRVVDSELAKTDQAQRAIDFHKGNSQKLFKKRLALLQQLKTRADSYLKGADGQSAALIAKRMSDAYSDLSQKILQSPVPEGLSSDERAKVEASLHSLADPLAEQAAQYQALVKNAPADQGDVALAANTTADVKAPADSRALETLHKDPFSSEALTELKTQFEQAGNRRLAAYFEGRLKQASSPATANESAPQAH
jgi:hypothetical protein